MRDEDIEKPYFPSYLSIKARPKGIGLPGMKELKGRPGELKGSHRGAERKTQGS